MSEATSRTKIPPTSQRSPAFSIRPSSESEASFPAWARKTIPPAFRSHLKRRPHSTESETATSSRRLPPFPGCPQDALSPLSSANPVFPVLPSTFSETRLTPACATLRQPLGKASLPPCKNPDYPSSLRGRKHESPAHIQSSPFLPLLRSTSEDPFRCRFAESNSRHLTDVRPISRRDARSPPEQQPDRQPTQVVTYPSAATQVPRPPPAGESLTIPPEQQPPPLRWKAPPYPTADNHQPTDDPPRPSTSPPLPPKPKRTPPAQRVRRSAPLHPPSDNLSTTAPRHPPAAQRHHRRPYPQPDTLATLAPLHHLRRRDLTPLRELQKLRPTIPTAPALENLTCLCRT
ncbi:PREDICTED: proline-rich receptor-like protein kinase PERK9 [Capra hircus]|uniref:proline-rich receptor-like protein kinase PERK9 n=1 Tax=Capra hircus TaxID=9925 RepID=UPI0008477194|nr:PREDICTED: proline-rich receptor-like protein kinase PERK9 [Capra hircus]